MDEELLTEALRAAERITRAQQAVEEARADHRRAVRALYLDGASMREIAERLGISHQRVHQLLDVPKPEPRWRSRRLLNGRGQLQCQFCGRSQTEVARLVPGPGTAICSDCVAHASALLEHGGSANRHAPAPLATPGGEGRCAFCDKRTGVPRTGPRPEPLDLVVAAGGLAGAICNECLALAAEIIAEPG